MGRVNNRKPRIRSLRTLSHFRRSWWMEQAGILNTVHGESRDHIFPLFFLHDPHVHDDVFIHLLYLKRFANLFKSHEASCRHFFGLLHPLQMQQNEEGWTRSEFCWISEGSPIIFHFSAWFGKNCLCWFLLKVSLLTLSWMCFSFYQTRFQNSNMIRMEMRCSTGPISSSCPSGFSTASGCSGTSCCLGPIGTKALARGFSVGRTDGAGQTTNENVAPTEKKRWKKQPNWLVEIYVMWMR